MCRGPAMFPVTTSRAWLAEAVDAPGQALEPGVAAARTVAGT